ncbi:hypothetical protein [Kineococcus glutinatus]|uniref:Uncharacterized protein n=1 Tax=Kineococcus glutinatus TaxID=1070872 RepID=A0ABP9HHC7_9ACTN
MSAGSRPPATAQHPAPHPGPRAVHPAVLRRPRALVLLVAAPVVLALVAVAAVPLLAAGGTAAASAELGAVLGTTLAAQLRYHDAHGTYAAETHQLAAGRAGGMVRILRADRTGFCLAAGDAATATVLFVDEGGQVDDDPCG